MQQTATRKTQTTCYLAPGLVSHPVKLDSADHRTQIEMDLKDVYFYIQIVHHHRPFLPFTFKGVAYQFSPAFQTVSGSHTFLMKRGVFLNIVFRCRPWLCRNAHRQFSSQWCHSYIGCFLPPQDFTEDAWPHDCCVLDLICAAWFGPLLFT